MDLRFFFKAWGLLVFGVVLIKMCLFFGLVFLQISFLRIVFFQILWHFCCFNSMLNEVWAGFCANLHIFGLFFRICLAAFVFNSPAGFMFFQFSYPMQIGLVFFR